MLSFFLQVFAECVW